MTVDEMNAKYGKPAVTPTQVGGSSELEQLWGTQTKPTLGTQLKDRLNNIKSAVVKPIEEAKTIGNDVQEGIISKPEGATLVGTEVARAPLRIAGQAGGAVADTIESGVKHITENPSLPGVINTVVPGATDMLSKIKDVVAPHLAEPMVNASTQWEEFKKNNPNLAADLGDIGNLFNLTGGGEAAGALKSVATDVVKSAPGELIDAAKGVKKVVSSNFEDSVNKAFPPLKNDMRDLSKRNASINTALTDIVNNKPTLGLTDTSGEPRLPENFTETNQVQRQRLKEIYSGYTAKLEGADKDQFNTDITSSIGSKIEELNSKLQKENSIENRNALATQIKELQGLRDTSPEGIQSYVESLNQQAKAAPGAPLSLKQIQAANLAGDMRKVLDDSIEKIDGTGYQDLRNVYAAHKKLESSLLSAAKKEINSTPGLMDKLTTLGVTGEGLNFLLTHDPHSLLVAAGVKGASTVMKWFNSPQRALKDIYSGLESGKY